MGRLVVAAAWAASFLGAGAASGAYELFGDEALGLVLNVPPGYEAEAVPAEDIPLEAASLIWRAGPYAGLEVLITRRAVSFANVVIWAGFYQRRRGASSSFEAEGELLAEGDLAAIGADEGLRASYIIREQETSRRLATLFLTSAGNIYVIEVSYPELAGDNLSAAAREMLRTVKISPPKAEEEAEANGGAGTEPPSE